MPQLQNKKHKKITFLKSNQSGRGSIASLIFMVILLGGLGSAYFYRQQILDWYVLRNYHAPAVVKQLADQDTMTPSARKIFYVNHPSLDKKDSFTQNCPDTKREQTIVLGCYHGNQAGIFLLEVSDPRLNGVEQVTAAHEMLHAAYDRMSSSEKSKINSMLLDFYNHGLTDERIKKTIDAYRKVEPKDVVNEMHSIFGTEVATLPANLEEHYKQYFSSRAAVATLSASYQAEFTSRQSAVADYDAQLPLLKAKIDADKADLQAKQGEISAKRANLEQLRSSNNISAYNAGVPVYNDLVDSYNNEIQDVKNLITEYNDMVAKRNATALQQNQLVEELKGNLQPIQQ